VLVAAQVKVRADAMWASASKAGDGMERGKCWKMILADEECGYILGEGDFAKGRR